MFVIVCTGLVAPVKQRLPFEDAQRKHAAPDGTGPGAGPGRGPGTGARLALRGASWQNGGRGKKEARNAREANCYKCTERDPEPGDPAYGERENEPPARAGACLFLTRRQPGPGEAPVRTFFTLGPLSRRTRLSRRPRVRFDRIRTLDSRSSRYHAAQWPIFKRISHAKVCVVFCLLSSNS